MRQKLLTDHEWNDTSIIYEDPLYNEVIKDLQEDNLISLEEAIYLRHLDENIII